MNLDAAIFDRKVEVSYLLEQIAQISFMSQREEYLNKIVASRKISKSVLNKDLRNILRKKKTISYVSSIANNRMIETPSLYVDADISMSGYSIRVPSIRDDGEFDSQNVYFIKFADKNDVQILLDENISYNGYNYTIRATSCPPIEKYYNGLNMFEEIADRGEINKKELYERVKQTVRKYVYLKNEIEYDIVTLYVLISYFYKCFMAVPFLFVYGPKGSGKSQLLTVLNALCFNSVKCAGVTTASFCDTINTYNGTMIIDQAEDLSSKLNKKNNLDLIGIIADSYTTHGGKKRIVINNGNRHVLEFNTYGPKVFASIRDIDDDIRDRCLMLNTTKTIVPVSKPSLNHDLFVLRKDLLRYMLLNASAIYRITKDAAISNRNEELLLPIEILYRHFTDNEQEQTLSMIKEHLNLSFSMTQFEPDEFEKTMFEILLNLSYNERYSDVIKVKSSTIKEKIREVTDKDNNKYITVQWVVGKFKQYGLIKSIEKKQEINNIVNKYYVISKEVLISQYNKYFNSDIEITTDSMTTNDSKKTEDTDIDDNKLPTENSSADFTNEEEFEEIVLGINQESSS